jgi:hypothetical protein
MGGIQLAKAASWPYDDRPAIAAERAGLEYGTFSALRLFVLLLYLSPEDRCAPAWHPIAPAGLSMIGIRWRRLSRSVEWRSFALLVVF